MTSTIVEVTFEVEVWHATLPDGTPYVKDVLVHTTLPPGDARTVIEGFAVRQWYDGIKEGRYV